MAKLNITKEEYEKLRRSGVSQQDIMKRYSASKEMPITNIASKVTNALGLKGTVDTIGTNVAQISNALNPTINTQEKLARSQTIGQTTLKQNVGAGFQLGSIAAPGGTTASLVKTVGVGALSGAAGFAGQAAAENRSAGTITQQAATGAAIGGGLALGARAIQGAAQTAFKYFIPKSKQEAVLLQTYKANKPFTQRILDAATGDSTAPRTVADTAFNKGIMGTETMMGIQAKRAQANIWKNVIKPQLDASTETIDLPTFFSKARQEIIKANPELTRQKALLTALDSIVEDYADTPAASLAKLHDYKVGWADFVPEKSYRGENIAGALNDVRDTLAGQARTTIYEKLGPAVRTAYLDHGNMEGLKALGQAEMTGGRLKGGTGGLINALIEKIMVPISTIGGMTVYKVGQGVELIGRPGLSTVGQFILDLTNESAPPQDTESTPQEISTMQSPSQEGTSGGVKVQGPFSGKEFEVGAPALSITGGINKLARTILQKAGPSGVERIKDLLRKFDTDDLNQQMTLLDNFGPFLKKIGAGDLSPDELIRVLDRVTSLAK